jgi:hypothetical protein
MTWVDRAYRDYTVHKQTYLELEEKYGLSGRTIRKYFDQRAEGLLAEFDYVDKPVSIIFDATFFVRVGF